MLCLEELHAISDTLGKHLEYENTQKEIDLFSIRKFEKESPQNLLTHALLAYSQVCP